MLVRVKEIRNMTFCEGHKRLHVVQGTSGMCEGCCRWGP